jgi:AraC-like DNA-binding protein
MPPAYFSLILREWGVSPRTRNALLDGIDVTETTEAPLAQITLGQQLRQVRNACRVLAPDWGLQLGARLHPAAHGALGVAAVSAPTLRQTLGVMTRFSSVRSPHFQLRGVIGGGEVRLLPEDRVALAAAERQALLDIVMLSTQGLIETVLCRPMCEGRFEYPGPVPEHAEVYARLFHAPVRFGCSAPAIVISADWISTEGPLVDSGLYDAALRNLLAGARRLHAGHTLVARVEELLARRGEKLRLSTAARILGVSARTLHRRLEREGTTYLTVVDGLRRARADALLRDPELTLAEIAHLLGYDDPANFGRAFRRWFDDSPASYRRRLSE